MDPMRQAKTPVTALAGPYGHPLHPAMVAVPIGAWIASLVFDVGSRVAGDGEFLARGSRWLIALGVLGALAAAVFGFLISWRFRRVRRRSGPRWCTFR